MYYGSFRFCDDQESCHRDRYLALRLPRRVLNISISSSREGPGGQPFAIFRPDDRSTEADYLSNLLMVKATTADIKMLGLSDYVHHILSVARSQQGDMSARCMVFGDWKQQFRYIHSQTWRTMSLYWFAMRAIAMADSRSSLARIQTTLDITSGLGRACGRFFINLKTLRDRCNNIRSLEMTLNTVSKIPDPDEAIDYFSSISPLGSGMDIELRDVSFRYKSGEKDILKGVTTHIPAGSLVCIVGRNGAGKVGMGVQLYGILLMYPASRHSSSY